MSTRIMMPVSKTITDNAMFWIEYTLTKIIKGNIIMSVQIQIVIKFDKILSIIMFTEIDWKQNSN